MPFARLLSASLCVVLLVSVGESQAGRPKPKGRTGLDERLQSWERHREMERSSEFRGLPWRSVGPVVQGGRLVDIEVSPDDPYTFYVAYASGGIWRTANNGLDFEPLTDALPSIIIGDLAVDPSDPQILWIGGGENNSSRSSYSGLGVFRSTDGGENWEYRGLGDTDRIGRLWIDPRDGNRILVASLGPLYTPDGKRGIYLTEDAGDHWKEVLNADGDWTGFVDLVADPTNPDTLYAASWERSRRPWNFVEGGPNSGVYKSTDSGRKWTRLEGGFPRNEFVGRIGLDICRSQPNTLYAYMDNQEPLPEEMWDLGDSAVTPKRLKKMSKEDFLAQDPEDVEDFVCNYDFHPSVTAESLLEDVKTDKVTLDDILTALQDANANLFDVDIKGAQVWRSDDGGSSWRKTHQEPIRELVYSYGYYFGQIRVSPTDPDKIYILGVPILSSSDGGKNWRSIQGRGVHGDYQAMWIDPENADRVVLGNDGGLAMSYDGGESWLVLNRNPVGQFYTIQVDNAKPYNIYGGLQDNGTYKGSVNTKPNVSGEWEHINGGDGFYVQIDPRDDKTTYAGFQFGYYTRIDPDGKRQRVRPRNKLKEDALRYNWQTPVILSHHNADIVYFGADKLFRSMDKGETWAALSEDLSRREDRGDVPFGTITTIDESRHRFGLLWCGTDDGQLWVSEDGGDEWRDAGDGLPKDRWVSRVIASRHEQDRVYVTLNGYRDDDMTAYAYSSQDLGRNWKSIADGLPTEPVNVIREDPEDEDTLYVGTDRGVYVSLDAGKSWQALDAQLPNVPVHDLAIQERESDLVAGTHGRSAWVLDIKPIEDLEDEIREKAIHLFKLEEIQFSRDWRGRPSRWYGHLSEDPSVPWNYWSKDGGEVTVRIRDEDDRLLREVSTAATPGVNVFDWDMLLDESLALKAEQASLAAPTEQDESDEDAAEEAAPRTPWSDAVELGWKLYVTAGEYKVEFVSGEETATADLTVKAPEKRDPRTSAPPVRPRRTGP